MKRLDCPIKEVLATALAWRARFAESESIVALCIASAGSNGMLVETLQALAGLSRSAISNATSNLTVCRHVVISRLRGKKNMSHLALFTAQPSLYVKLNVSPPEGYA